LHLLEHLFALVHVGGHHALHGRLLEIEELRPEIGLHLGILAIDGARLLLQLLLEFHENLDVVFQVFAEHALHGVAIKTDHLPEKLGGKNRHAAAFFLQDDLQQDAAGQVIAGLGIHHLEFLEAQHQILDVGQGDVGTGLGVVETPVGVLLDQSSLVRH
jgi:hypothetical protein